MAPFHRLVQGYPYRVETDNDRKETIRMSAKQSVFGILTSGSRQKKRGFVKHDSATVWNENLPVKKETKMVRPMADYSQFPLEKSKVQ